MNFELIANKYPSEQEAIAKLETILSQARRQENEFTLNRLCDLVTPHNREQFAMIVGELTRSGLVKSVIRVISPSTQGGVCDYPNLNDVPEVVHDWRTDSELHVSPENLRVIYKVDHS